MTRVTGKYLASKYRIETQQALYRESGDWFHILERFPAALFDSKGYVLFKTREEYEAFVTSGKGFGVNEYKTSNTLTISGGISSCDGYTKYPEHNLPENVFPEEIVESENYFEGSTKRILVNRYERDSRARETCINHWGLSCSVCEIELSRVYGEIGVGFIHVHHLTPISSIGAMYRLDAINDLRPVCPNCHAMLHKKDPPLTIEALKEILTRQRGS